MTPTSNERREAAARLREYATGFDFGDSDPWWYVQNAVFDDAIAHDAPEAFDRLADLIDPITTVELRAPWTICMKCGARMEGYQRKPVRFCPHFGRRIVR